MDSIRSAFRWVRAKFRRFQDLSNGDDLYDAQHQRGDDHEFRMLPPGP